MRRFLIVFLLFLSLPLALGVGFGELPQQREYLFEPGKHFELTFAVVGEEHIGFSISTNTPGNPDTIGTSEDDNILEYVTVHDPDPNGPSRWITLEINLPQSMKPGVYNIDMYARGISGEGTVGAFATLKHRFVVRVLSPEKRIDVYGPFAQPIAEGLDADVSARVVSRTTQNIKSVFTTFKLYYGEELVAEKSTPAFALPTGTEQTTEAVMSTASLTGGEYTLKVTGYYDGGVQEGGTLILKIGSLHVGIPNWTKELLVNATNKFEFTIRNEWNQELRQVFAKVTLNGQEKQTADKNIPPFGETTYEIYFDKDPALSVGEHTVEIAVNYSDFNPKSQSRVDKLEIIPVQVHVIAPEKKSIDVRSIILYSVIGILLLLLILILILLLRTKKRDA